MAHYLDRVLFTYSLSHLTYSDKIRFYYALKGRDGKSGIVKDYMSNRLVSLETVNELYRLIPEEIYLNNITLEDDGTVTIQGVSESMSRVFSFVTALEESDFFKSVKTNSTAAKKDRGKDVATFELSFKLMYAKDEKEEDSEEKASEGTAKKESEKESAKEETKK